MNKSLVVTTLSLGFVFLLSSTNIVFQKNPTEEDKSDAWEAFVIGIASTSFGGWLIWDAREKDRQQLEQAKKDFLLELDSIFLEQIQASQGNISYISFAIAAKISLEESQQYLDRKSVQLNSILNIDDDGATSYHFSLPRNLL